MQSTINPFRPTRWEHTRDDNQLIWYTSAAAVLTGEKAVYVRGSRGSGKTTLLKSICWEDLAKNASLRMQRSLGDFEHLGIYIRFPDHISASFSRNAWQSAYPNAPEPDLEYHRLFSLVVELTCVEKALSAVHELRVMNMLTTSPSQELDVVSAMRDEYPQLDLLSNSEPQTFIELSRAYRVAVRRINEACGRGTLPSLETQMPARQPGELLSLAATRLTRAFQISTPQGAKRVSLKFCLDDCETMSLEQQVSVNTLVRSSKHPVSWVVSSVGFKFDSTDTYIPQQPLTDADRKILPLDSRGDVEFGSLCQSVVGLRLLFSVSEEFRREHGSQSISGFFSLQERLGTRPVNAMMQVISDRSASPLAAQVRSGARTLKDALAKGPFAQGGRYGPDAPGLPWYEAYTLMLWRGREDSFATEPDAQSLARLADVAPSFEQDGFAAWLRRKQRGALLHYAAKMGFKRLPLGGAPIVLSLADGSVRDFLEILGEIYEAYARKRKVDPADPTRFDRFSLSRTRIGWAEQAEGIYNASEAYFSGISSRAGVDPDVVSRLLEGLGHFTSILQSDPNDPTVLGRAERGVFSVRFDRPSPEFLGDPAPARAVSVWNAINQAEIAGYVRVLSVKFLDGREIAERETERARVLTFRLHRRFAPRFHFSYRNAYELVGVSVSDLWQLCDRERPADPRSWAERLASRSSGADDAQLSLALDADELASLPGLDAAEQIDD